MQNGHLTAEHIGNEIKRMIADITEREAIEIPDNASFSDDLGVDSLMAMEVMITMDKRFKIDIPEEEFMTAKNVADAVAMVQRYLPDRVVSAGI